MVEYMLMCARGHKRLTVCVRVVENKVEGAGQRRKTVMEHRDKQRKKRGGGGKRIGVTPMFAQDMCMWGVGVGHRVSC